MNKGESERSNDKGSTQIKGSGGDGGAGKGDK